MDSNVDDTLVGTDDCDVVDLTMSEVPIDSPEVAASLPPPDQFVRDPRGSVRSSSSDIPTKNRRYLWFALAGTALIAIILGLSIGLTSQSGQSGAAGASSRGSSSGVEEARKATADAAIEYFVNNNVSLAGDFRNPSSPQAKAIAWLTKVDGRNLPVPGHPISAPVGYYFLSRFVLAVLYFALDGENWTLNPYWLSGDDFCSGWNIALRGQSASGDVFLIPLGAYCDKISKKVMEIHLNSNKLKGSIPKELAHLTSLRRLTMSGNEIKGSFPKEVCAFEELSVLLLSRNELLGTVPTCLSGLKNLEILSLSRNELSGEMADMSAMSQMEQLALDNNTMLTGDVTKALNNMTKLQFLYLDDTSLGGHVDHNFLRRSVNLTEIDLSRSSFRGGIPTHLLELSSVRVLDLHGNSLHGSLPDVTKWNSALQYLALSGNRFNGSIPEAIGSLSSLVHLDLSQNQFTGTLPMAALSNLTNLQRLYLSENGFTAGPIPSLEQLTKLTELSLKNTSRTGSIPSSLGGLDKLILLDLDDNKLNGTIPAEIGELVDLEFLLLNRNEALEGALPASLGRLSSLRMILLDRTALNGSLNVLCDLPSFSENANRTGILSADCADANDTAAEVTCTCCQHCCRDNDPSNCQDFDEVPSLELEWQYGNKRVEGFDFGGSAYFTSQTP